MSSVIFWMLFSNESLTLEIRVDYLIWAQAKYPEFLYTNKSPNSASSFLATWFILNWAWDIPVNLLTSMAYFQYRCKSMSSLSFQLNSRRFKIMLPIYSIRRCFNQECPTVNNGQKKQRSENVERKLTNSEKNKNFSKFSQRRLLFFFHDLYFL